MIHVVVDDERTFNLGTSYLVHRTARAAIEWITDYPEFKCDILWLDHDLGTDEDGNNITIMPFVHTLCKMSYHGQPMNVGRINVHSQNPVGAENVVKSLARWEYNVKATPLPPLAGRSVR